MRKFKSLLKPYLRKILHDSRKAVGISQEQMAALLRISPRSYGDLERGKSGFSAVTLVFFRALLPDEEIIRIVRGFFLLMLDSEEKEDAS